MMAVEMKPLDGRRKFRIKKKEKVQNPVLPGCNKRKLSSFDTGAEDQPNLKKSKIDPVVEKRKLVEGVVKDSNPTTSKSGAALNGETDLKKLLLAAKAARMKRQQFDEYRNVQQEAKAISDPRSSIDARRTEEREARADLQKNVIFDKDKVTPYDQLLQLSGCFLSYNSRVAVVLRMRENKTGKIVDPLACIGLHLKKEFIPNASDYDEYVDADIEEGEIIDSDPRSTIDARRTEQRKAQAELQKSMIFDKDKVISYDQLLQLSGCFLSYDSHVAVVLRMRKNKTGKRVDPLACIGLHLKKEFIASASDYDEYVDADIEEGEIIDSDCDTNLEEGEILE